MPNALNSGGVIRSYYGGQDDAQQAQQQNALSGMRQTQFDQQNTQFQQGQDDRRKQQLREDGTAFIAGIAQTPPEARAQVYSQWRPAFAQMYPEVGQALPEQYDDATFGELIGRSGLLAPEAAQKLVMERFSPQQADASKSQFIGVDQTGRPISFDPSNRQYHYGDPIKGLRTPSQASVFDVSRERELGKGVGEAQFSVPEQEFYANETVRMVDELIAHPGKEIAVGFVAGKVGALTPEAKNFTTRLEQIQGRAFLAARQMLKGGGQITDFESRKAEAAFLRAERAQTVEEFDAAMREFAEQVRVGQQKLQAKANMRPDGSVPSAAGAAPPAAPASAAAKIKSDAEYDALPSGAAFIDPDGNERVKP